MRRGTQVIVAGLFSAREAAAQELEALARRVEDAGAVVVGRVLQRRGVSRGRRPGGAKTMDRPLHAATVIGKGKALELAELCRTTAAELVVFWNALSETQRLNLETICATPVTDAAGLGLV